MTPPRAIARSYVPQGVAAGRRPLVARRNACALRNPALRPTCGSTQQSTVYGDGTTANGGIGAKDQPIKTIAHDGTVTFYQYTAKGQEAQKATYPSTYASATTRPALSLATSVISSRWHTTFNLLTKRAEPGKFTVWAYANDTGNLTAQSETITTDATGAATFNAVQKPNTAIKSTGWAYHATMQLPTSEVVKSDGVQVSKYTLSYSTLGDVSKVTNSVNNTTHTIQSVDAHGKPTSIRLPDSTQQTTAYDLKSRLIQTSVGTRTQRYSYKTSGEIESLRFSDGTRDVVTASFTYDASHNLIEMTINGNRINQQSSAATLDISSNSSATLNKTTSTTDSSPTAFIGKLFDAFINPFATQSSAMDQQTASQKIIGQELSQVTATNTADETPDYSSCSIYDQLALKKKCNYDAVAAGICRADFTVWSVGANSFLRTCIANDSKPVATTNCIRKCLAYAQRDAHDGKDNCLVGAEKRCLTCPSRPCIHNYHLRCYSSCNVSPWCYGGWAWPWLPTGQSQ
jgi:YD repeat-containing protein